MESADNYARDLYIKNNYLIKNPSLHEEDSPWKVNKIIPLIDELLGYINKPEINLLDIGGGAGLILNAVCAYIKERHGIKVNKYALDLSPGMLAIQKKKNPDLKNVLNENIRKTSLNNKEIDITLLIDLLEHIPHPIDALKEVKRISKFAIFKIPLEDNLFFEIWNFIKMGKPKKWRTETIGHLNIYNFNKLKSQIETYAGRILHFYFTNVFGYYRTSEHYKNKISARNKLLNLIAERIFKLSPKLCSRIFNDFVMISVKCD